MSDALGSGRLLKEDSYPDILDFDPLNRKPGDPEEFAFMQTKELQNGSFAILGIAGMVAQKQSFVSLGLAVNRFDPSLLPVQF